MNRFTRGVLIAFFILSLVAGIVCGAVSMISFDINAIMILLAVALFVVGISGLSFITSSYNKLVRYKNKVAESLALIDIQLKLRFDLIPNLVATVKGYASHEEKVFSEITKLRKQAIEATDEAQKLEYANAIVPKMRNIIAIAENYPQLKADALFKSLMDELVLVEDKIVASRRFYDSNVNLYNTALEVWPTNIIAKLYEFKKEPLFKIDAGERIAIKVEL